MATLSEDRKLQSSRINAVIVLVIVLFLVIIIRLYFLQIIKGDELLHDSETNRLKLIRSRAPRGTILDSKNRVLATSRPQFVVVAIPEVINSSPEGLHTLAGILQISADELKSIMEKRENRPGSPVRIAIDVPLETVSRIGELRMKLPSVSVELDHIRNYPHSNSLAHVIGYLGEISQEKLEEANDSGKDYNMGDYVGKAGLEVRYEDDLRGIDGGKQVEVNAMGRVIRVVGDKPSRPGATLKLTIDKDLQLAAVRALGRQVGGAVALDPQTGAVLAMASSPSFDPNIFVKKVKTADWNNIIQNKSKPLQNRTIGNVYPPGSTFKPIMAIGGLKNGACNLNTYAYCPGYYILNKYKKRCWKTHGSVSFMKAISESCDVWFYQMSIRLGIGNMVDIARQFGIGKATGIDLPGERADLGEKFGTMPTSAWKKKKLKERWYLGDTLNVSIGQGYVQVSPLQMALATAAFPLQHTAGKLCLYLQQQHPGEESFWKMSPQVVSSIDAPAQDFDLVKSAMRQTITSGTGRVCDVKDVTVCGKSGSAEARGAAHGWFVCFAPQENPKIAIAVIVEHGRHGATSAAPVCRAILDVYFGKKKAQDIKQFMAKVSGD